jgi:hypothetical protein
MATALHPALPQVGLHDDLQRLLAVAADWFMSLPFPIQIGVVVVGAALTYVLWVALRLLLAAFYGGFRGLG